MDPDDMANIVLLGLLAIAFGVGFAAGRVSITSRMPRWMCVKCAGTGLSLGVRCKRCDGCGGQPRIQ